MRMNQPVLHDTHAVAMPLRMGSMRRLTAANGNASFSSETGNSSRHQNSVLAASQRVLSTPVIHASRPRGTGMARRRRGCGAAGWACESAGDAAREAPVEGFGVVMAASVLSARGLRLE